MKGNPSFAQGYAIELGFLLYGHGNLDSKNYLPPLGLGILELEIFTRLGFCVVLVYSTFGVYGLACSSFKMDSH